jgi:L-asparagine oxygenase
MLKEFSYTDCRSEQYELPAPDAELIRRHSVELVRRYPAGSLHDEDLLAEAESMSAGLSEGLKRVVLDFRNHSNQHGGMLISGLPIECTVATPAADQEVYRWQELPLETTGQLLVMSLMGQAFAFADEKEGLLIQDVFPKATHAARQENSGSVLMELHTEDGFHPHAPEWLSLLCLRGGSGHEGVSVTSSVLTALPDLDEATVSALRRPDFRIRISSSFLPEGTVGPLYSEPAPILSGSRECPDLLLDMNASEATTAAGEAALAALVEAVESHLRGFLPQPGDLVIVDNRRAVHGRTGFTPRYDGSDRWLRRIFVTRDLRRMSPFLQTGRVHRALQLADPPRPA